MVERQFCNLDTRVRFSHCPLCGYGATASTIGFQPTDQGSIPCSHA